jgi:type IV pilus assembly protein PilQ
VIGLRLSLLALTAAFALSACTSANRRDHDRSAIELLHAYEQKNETMPANGIPAPLPGVEELRVDHAADGEPRVSLIANSVPILSLVRAVLDMTGKDYAIEVEDLPGTYTGRISNRSLPDALAMLLDGRGAVADFSKTQLRIVADPKANADASANLIVDKDDGTAVATLFFRNITAGEAKDALAALYNSSDGDDEGASVGSAEIKGRNGLVLTGDRGRVQQAVTALRQLDMTDTHIFIEALLVEFDVNSFVDLGTQLSEAQSGPISAGFLDLANLVGGTAAFTYTAGQDFTDSFRLMITALNERDEARVLSRPFVTTISGRQAKLDISEDRYVVAQSSNGLIANLQQVSSGVALQVTPTLMGDGRIMLNYDVTESRFVPTLENVEVRRARNNVASYSVVRNGETVIVGGLMSRSLTSAKAGIPGLRNVPLLNLGGGHNEDTEDAHQIMVFITPHVWRPGMKVPAIRSEFFEHGAKYSKELGNVLHGSDGSATPESPKPGK